MEQKDYLLREIEKIGILLRAILNSLIGKKENLTVTNSNSFEETKEQLFSEIGFDLEKFLKLEKSDFKGYFSEFNGINTENIELLAEILFQLGTNDISDNKIIYFEKALQLYEFCNLTDKTFSFERENKINEIKNVL